MCTYDSIIRTFSEENLHSSEDSFRISKRKRIYSDDLSLFLKNIAEADKPKEDTTIKSESLDIRMSLGSPMRCSTPIISTSQEEDITPYSPNRFLEMALGSELSISPLTILNAQAASATNALNWCKMSPEFFYSRERIEAERIYLLINRRCEQCEMTMSPKISEIFNNPKGNLTFDNISLPLKVDQTLQASNFWYLIEFAINQQVMMTNASSGVAVYGNDDRPRVSFPGDSFNFENLPSNFKLHIRIYQLKLNPNDSRRRFSKIKAKKWLETMCSSKALRWLKSINKNNNDNNPSDQMTPSTFERSGDFLKVAQADFGLNELISGSKLAFEQVRPHPFISQQFVTDCVLAGTLDARVQSSVHLGKETNHMGFVNYAICSNEDMIRHWERVWCLLENGLLRFWYYPNIVDYTAPIYTIDLNRCLLTKISIATRIVCPRPRTLVIITCQVEQISQAHECEQKKYFLSIDKEDELEEWIEKMDEILRSLQTWQLDSKCQRLVKN